MGHRRGESREQAALFPVMLDELVPQDALARVIDLWIDRLDLQALGFAKSVPQVRGAPPYAPADLLKLYVWGYLNSVRSSRELERACHRDVECMWLLGRLAPDHKTISEFRRASSAALVATCAAFVSFARTQKLIQGSTLAIDGSKVRAVASRKAAISRERLQRLAQRNAQEIAEYLKLLDERDRQDEGRTPQADDVRRALAELQRRQDGYQADVQRLMELDKNSLVKTEEEAQPMHSLQKAPGYNLQAAVETGSHLIVAHAVTNEATDQNQLQPVAELAGAALQQPCTVLADAGYANGEHIAKLAEAGFTTFVAPKRSPNGDGTLYDKSAFSFDAQKDCFTCPAGKTLPRKHLHRRDKLVIYAARAADCASCPNKGQCTNARRRVVSRHFYEDAMEANAQRLTQRPEMMKLRQQTVEHTFDAIKNRILRTGRLLVRGLKGATAELSIAVLAYNLRRSFNMKGAAWMHQAMQG